MSRKITLLGVLAVIAALTMVNPAMAMAEVKDENLTQAESLGEYRYYQLATYAGGIWQIKIYLPASEDKGEDLIKELDQSGLGRVSAAIGVVIHNNKSFPAHLWLSGKKGEERLYVYSRYFEYCSNYLKEKFPVIFHFSDLNRPIEGKTITIIGGAWDE